MLLSHDTAAQPSRRPLPGCWPGVTTGRGALTSSSWRDLQASEWNCARQ